MKDNYSWLDDLMGWYERDGETWQPKSWEMSEDLNVTNVKQTIISQIEIEKLRARIEELQNLGMGAGEYGEDTDYCVPLKTIILRIAELRKTL